MPTIADIRAQYPQYQDMQDNQLADALYGKFYSDMPREQFNAKIGLTQPAPQAQPAQTDATSGNMFSDVIPEIKNAASENIDAIKNMYGGTADKGIIQKQLDVGKGLLAIPGLLASPLTGATRSLIGHPMASAEHAIGSVIAPDIASKDNPQEMYTAAKGNVDQAMMGLAPRGASPVAIKTVPGPVPTAPELKSAATAGYDAAKNSGVEIKPSSLVNFTAKIQSDLSADGLNEILAPKTFGILDKLGKPPEGAIVTTNDFRTMQRSLGMAAKSPDPTERLAATRAISALNDHVENIPAGELLRGTQTDASNVSSTVKEANANYKAYKQSEDFTFRGTKATNNAEAANSGMNLENQLRSQVRQILNNKNLQRGYDAETLAAFRAFNQGSRTANILRMVGNALGGGGGIGALIAGAVGHMAIPFVGAAAPAVGFGLKAAGNARAASQFAKLGQTIRARSPLALSRPPIPLPPPNPVLSGLIAGRLTIPQMLGMQGAIPARAQDQQ